MTKPPPRKRFQFHLSTAIVMMLVAGILIGANTFCFLTVGEEYASNGQHWTFYKYDRGFPMTLYWNYAEYGPFYFSYTGMIINSLFALIVLGLIWFINEWLIRRRAARK